MVNVADTIDKTGLKLSDLKNFGSCLYKKDDKSPILYAKVIYNSNTDLVITSFYEKEKIDEEF